MSLKSDQLELGFSIVLDHFAGVHNYSRNINLLTYVNLGPVHMTYFAHGVYLLISKYTFA